MATGTIPKVKSIKSVDVNVVINTYGYGGYFGDTNLPVSMDKIISIFEIGADSNTPCVVTIINQSGIRCLSLDGAKSFCTVRVIYTE